jgi:hypothetical protein
MAPQGFYLQHHLSLRADDFERSPLWAPYYSFDDVEEMVSWGYPEPLVRECLAEINYSDDYYFPLPVEAANSEWGRDKLFAVTIVAPNEVRLSGYVGETHRYVAVFAKGQTIYLDNLDLGSGYATIRDDDQRLAALLGIRTSLPLRVMNRVTGENWIHDAVTPAKDRGRT